MVLAGGLSHERDVSLRSGRRVAEALRGSGLEVEERDVDAGLLPALAADPPACVVPMLHGETGEDGAIREVLELLGLPYVGAGPGGVPDRLRQAGGQDRGRARPASAPPSPSACRTRRSASWARPTVMDALVDHAWGCR